MDQDDVLAVFDALYVAACVKRDAASAVDLFVDDARISFAGSDLAEHATTKAELLALMRSIATSPTTLRFEWPERHVQVTGDTA